MRKIIPIIAIFLLMMASCQQSGKVSEQGDLFADSVDVATILKMDSLEKRSFYLSLTDSFAPMT